MTARTERHAAGAGSGPAAEDRTGMFTEAQS
jgi:hypothetical protein